jgi:hypothetical protein
MGRPGEVTLKGEEISGEQPGAQGRLRTRGAVGPKAVGPSEPKGERGMIADEGSRGIR